MKQKKNKSNWIKTVFQFAKECKWKMFLSVICALISVTGGFIPYIGIYKIICLFMKENASLEEILYYAGICVAGYLIKIIFYGISTIMSHISAFTILETIRLHLARKMMKVPLGEIVSDTSGHLKNLVIDRVDTIELPLAHMIPEVISNLFLPIAVFIYLVTINWTMALATLVTVPFALVGFIVMMKGFSKNYDHYMTTSNYVNSVMLEYVEGIEVIKAFNQTSSSYEKFVNAVYSFKQSTLDWYKATWLSKNFCMSVLPSTLLGSLPLGMYLYNQGKITPAEVTICLILALSIIGPFVTLANLLNDVKSIEYAVKETNEFLQMKELQDCKDNVQFLDYNIELKNVAFTYSDENHMVIKNVNLEIPAGKMTALVGPSGGGKSTIARLIARFWDPTSGVITIGGHDIRKIPMDQLADTISYVTQDNFLFDCSLLENIRLGNPKASDFEVRDAAKKACCDEFITKLEHGYETMAGEAGDKLSGGEKQRIAIARAILKNAPIVILDEATAFTDPQSEDKIQQSIQELTKGKTLIVIAHRLYTIKNAGQIVVLKDGRITNVGKQEELLNNSEIYQKMWQAHIGSKHWSANSVEREAK